MDQHCCVECGSTLRPSEAKNGKKRCILCICQRRIAFLLTEEALAHAFSKLWIRDLFTRLASFLQQHQIPLEAQARLLSKAALLFEEADRSFRWPQQMQEQWLGERIEHMGHVATGYLRAFLIEERLLSEQSRDEKALKALQARVEQLPAAYRRLVEMFLNERLAWRQRQMEQLASRPLAVSTLVADVEILARLVRWLQANRPELSGWEMVQEEPIHAFLLTLTPKNRELMRKD